jgi:hypothetical protein
VSNIAIQGAATGTGVFTLASPATNTNRTLTLPDEAGTVLTSASDVAQRGVPAFAAYSSAAQNPTSGVHTKVIFGTEAYDTNSNYDPVLARFTPAVAGYYLLNASVAMSSDSGMSAGGVFFYKNGSSSLEITGAEDTALSGVGYQTILASALVYLNGSTDYVEVYAFATGTGTYRYFFASGGLHPTAFNGVLVRAA